MSMKSRLSSLIHSRIFVCDGGKRTTSRAINQQPDNMLFKKLKLTLPPPLDDRAYGIFADLHKMTFAVSLIPTHTPKWSDYHYLVGYTQHSTHCQQFIKATLVPQIHINFEHMILSNWYFKFTTCTMMCRLFMFKATHARDQYSHAQIRQGWQKRSRTCRSLSSWAI